MYFIRKLKGRGCDNEQRLKASLSYSHHAYFQADFGGRHLDVSIFTFTLAKAILGSCFPWSNNCDPNFYLWQSVLSGLLTQGSDVAKLGHSAFITSELSARVLKDKPMTLFRLACFSPKDGTQSFSYFRSKPSPTAARPTPARTVCTTFTLS